MNTKIMASAQGNFTLYVSTGVGIRETPWVRLEVRTGETANKHVVGIYLGQGWGVAFEGKPVQIKYNKVWVSHGMRCAVDTMEDTEEYIKVLKEALKFAKQVEAYAKDNGWWDEEKEGN